MKNHYTAQWSITGGIVPGLGDFETEADNKNILTVRPGSGANVWENLGKHRALSDVEKANLTYHGTLTGPPPLGDWDFQGVICP